MLRERVNKAMTAPSTGSASAHGMNDLRAEPKRHMEQRRSDRADRIGQ
jgi:hypothetical protein